MPLQTQFRFADFAKTIGLCLALSNSLYLVVAWSLARFFRYPKASNQLSAGFSAALFALKVIANIDEQGYSRIPFIGLVVPTKFAVWVSCLHGKLNLIC